MSRFLALATVVSGLALLATSSVAAGPITKQNGTTPVFKDFTSICSVPGYVDFGSCGADPTNAIQAKLDRWNLGISFTGLEPNQPYRLWGNQDGATPTPYVVGGFFVVGDGTADANGNLSFSYQTSNPNNLGFDLNRMPWNITIVTSYWSQQAIKVLNPDGTLYVPAS